MPRNIRIKIIRGESQIETVLRNILALTELNYNLCTYGDGDSVTTTRTYSKSINESLGDFARDSKTGRITIFLSHKHDEREYLDAAISLLKNFGVKIYVDW